MSETVTEPEAKEEPPGREAAPQRFRLVAVVVVAAVAALLVWLTVRGGDEGGDDAANAVSVTPRGLQSFVSGLRQPVYWVGPMEGATYEVTREGGQIRLRYLPEGVEVGDPTPRLTVGTYRLEDAYSATQRAAEQPGAELIRTRDDALAFHRQDARYSAFLAYPGSQYQVEVFHPRAGRARRLVASGRVTPAPGSPAEAARPETVSEAELRRQARETGQPIYWAGPDPDSRYELTRTPEGWFYVRYVPRDAPAGSTDPSLTVGTYPVADALQAVEDLAEAEGAERIELEGGGVAVLNQRFPRSIYLAYPDSDYQVEVFAPTREEARGVVTSGRIAPVE